MNVDLLACDCKTTLSDFKLINAVRQPLHNQGTLIGSCQSIPITIRITRNLNRGFHTQPSRIDHFKAQFAAIALTEHALDEPARAKK